MTRILGSRQAMTPEEATMFETAHEAAKTADAILSKSRSWRVDGFMNKGEAMCVIKHWPSNKTEICAERRWLKVGETRPKRRENGEEE